MIRINNNVIDIKSFPDGTPLLLDMPAVEDNCILRWCYEPGEEFAFFAVAKHCRQFARNLILEIPYIPNARMDRVKNDSECFTLKYFCDLVNAIEADEVYVNDPHSKVSLDLMLRSHEMGYNGFKSVLGIRNLLKKLIVEYAASSNCFYCFPDKGAMDKYSPQLNDLPILYGEKQRNWKTGRIESLDIVNNTGKSLNQATVFLIDDICSYGGTIVRCAEKLKNLGAGKVVVFVSHCENAMLLGKIPNDVNVDEFYTTDSIFTDDYKDIDKIHVFDCWRG